jgi:hypothetical protein
VVEGANPDEAVVDDEVDDEAVAVEVFAVPGIVLALMAAKRPTPRSELMAAPVVSRLSRRMAASRARTLAWVVSLVSMPVSVGARTKSRL